MNRALSDMTVDNWSYDSRDGEPIRLERSFGLAALSARSPSGIGSSISASKVSRLDLNKVSIFRQSRISGMLSSCSTVSHNLKNRTCLNRGCNSGEDHWFSWSCFDMSSVAVVEWPDLSFATGPGFIHIQSWGLHGSTSVSGVMGLCKPRFCVYRNDKIAVYGLSVNGPVQNMWNIRGLSGSPSHVISFSCVEVGGVRDGRSKAGSHSASGCFFKPELDSICVGFEILWDNEIVSLLV